MTPTSPVTTPGYHSGRTAPNKGRTYPPELAGELYPEGIPIHAEEELIALIGKHGVREVTMSYSDLPHEVVMHKAALARFCRTTSTMFAAGVPLVVAGAGVPAGSGRSLFHHHDGHHY